MKPNPSLASWLSPDTPPAPDESKEAIFAEYLLDQRPLAEGPHLGLIVVVAVLLWGSLPASVLGGWVLALTGAMTLCALLLRRLGRERPSPESVLAALRLGAAMVGLAWGTGAGLVIPMLPQLEQLFVVVAVVGLLSGSAMSLLADPTSFAVLVASVGLGGALPLAYSEVPVVTAMIMTGSAGVVGLVAMLFRRSHLLLRRYLEAARKLEGVNHAVIREQRILDAILMHAPSAIAIIDGAGRVLGANPGFSRLFGHKIDEVVGRTLAYVFDLSPGDVPELSETRGPVETTRRNRSGKDRPVLLAAGEVMGDRGTRVVVYEDLTNVHEARRVIEESKEQYRQLVEASPDLVWRIDRECRWAFVNDAARTLYEADPDALVGTSLFEMIAPELVETDRAVLKRVLEGEELVDHRTVHRDARGRRKHLSLSARPVRATDGVIVGAQGVARDVTPVVEALADLERARHAAEHQAETSASFLANMSHEIRTPLNGMLGMSDLLLETQLDYEQRQSLELMRTSAESLLAILNDILDFSKIEAGGMTLEEIPIDVVPLVDSVVRILAVRAFERQLDLVYDIGPEVPRRIVADPGRLRQILTNLIENAIKFTERGDVVVRASVLSRDETTARLRIEVSDTGVGIAPDRLEAIFEEYAQTDVSTARRYGGTGLGLAITRRLVQLMGGEIDVTSDEGMGSTFGITVPVRYEQEPSRPPSRNQVVLAGVRTLLVGNSATSRAIVADQLRRVGVDVIEAPTVDAAHEMLEGEASDAAVAIIDAHLIDGLDGFELARWIRSRRASIRVMMLTAAGQRGDGRRCREEGVAAYLTKPVARTELLEALASVVAGERAQVGAGSATDELITRYSIVESRQRLQVLVAEDNPVNQKVTETMLAKRGHQVDVVTDGRAAVAAARSGSYHVILMDINLPELSGIEALSAIRDGGGTKLPIVAVTAHALPQQRQAILEHGFDGCLVKPFRPHELFAAVEGWMIEGETESVLTDGGASAPDPVNWDSLLESMREAGIVEALPAIVDVFAQDAPGRLVALEEAAKERSAVGIEAAAHAFKSAAGTIRADSLARLLHHVESAGREGRVDDAVRLSAKAREEYGRVSHFLDQIAVAT